MPSVIVGNLTGSGAQVVLSGNYFSGRGPQPIQGGVLLRYIGSGVCYIGTSGFGPPLSGNAMSINSGAIAGSGGVYSGQLDGFPLLTGDSLFLPRCDLNVPELSGQYAPIGALTDAAGSGGRLYILVM